MANQSRGRNIFRNLRENKYILLIISCLFPAVYFVTVFLFLRLYLPAVGCLAIFLLCLILYYKPLKKREFSAMFRVILIFAYCFELLAAFYLEWEMGVQNLLFALIPLCFSFLYLDNNYEQMIPHGICYSVLVVLCYLFCSAVDFMVSPKTGATHFEIRMISGFSSVLTMGMTFVYVIVFVIELSAAHKRLMEETADRLDGMRSSLMLSQMKPHFLYNTIGAIEEMIDTDPSRAKRELEGFARYMRMNIDTLSSQELVSFEKELSHVKSYVQIQNLRFGDTISMEYDIASTDFKLPPLTIQPIVENAIKHGLRPKGGRGSIQLTEYEDEAAYIISIKDDGVGMNMERPKTALGSTGLRNIHYRLEKLCGGYIKMESTPGCGATVIVTIPKIKTKEKGSYENDSCGR